MCTAELLEQYELRFVNTCTVGLVIVLVQRIALTSAVYWNGMSCRKYLRKIFCISEKEKIIFFNNKKDTYHKVLQFMLAIDIIK